MACLKVWDGSEWVTIGAVNRSIGQFYGADNSLGVTSVEVMGDNVDMGVPVTRASQAANVAVRFRRKGIVSSDWTLRLFKNGTEVATFAVDTT